MSRSSHQRQRHGVRKHLVEGIGGLMVGAALVLLLRGLFQRQSAGSATARIGTTDEPTAGTRTTSGDSA